MKPTAFLLMLATIPGVATAAEATDVVAAPPAPPVQAATLAGELGKRLRDELQVAMQAGGPLAAIGACHDKALPVTARFGEEAGWEVGRTSLRVRNPDNAPDAWERSVLERFEQRHAAGEPVAALEHHETVTVGTHRFFRYMKAIPAGEPCLVCHGNAIAPPVQARLRELYPDDRATGFVAGDLRGAFSLTRQLD